MPVTLNASKTGSGSVAFSDVFENTGYHIKSITLVSGVGNLNGTAMTIGTRYDVSNLLSITLSRGESSGAISSEFLFHCAV